MEFAFAVWTATDDVYSCVVVHPSLLVSVVVEPNPKRENPVVLDVETMFVEEFIAVMEWLVPTRVLPP
jgi:hypothetical protein